MAELHVIARATRPFTKNSIELQVLLVATQFQIGPVSALDSSSKVAWTEVVRVEDWRPF